MRSWTQVPRLIGQEWEVVPIILAHRPFSLDCLNQPGLIKGMTFPLVP